MNDPRLRHVDPASWAYESLIGQLREWTPRAPVRVITSDANINPLDGLILVSGTTTVTLETAIGSDGRPHNIINIGTDTVTIACTGTETINGASTLTLSSQYDGVIVFPDGSNWLSVAKPGGGSTGSGNGAVAECQLSRSNATTLILLPHRGNKRTFHSGVTVTVPSAGVTVGTTGLSADTTYFVYSSTSDDTEVTDLVLSTTGYTIDSASGLAVRSGSGGEAFALEGMVRTNSSTQFVDTASQRFVRTWNNDNGIYMQGSTVSGGTSNTTAQLVSGGTIEFLAWASEWIDVNWQGYHKNDTAGQSMQVQMFLNGALNAFGMALLNTSGTANEWHAFNVRHVGITGTEGYNFINGYHHAVSSGTTNINSSQLVGHTRGRGSGA